MPNQANNLLRNIAQGLAALGGGVSSPMSKTSKVAKAATTKAASAAKDATKQTQAREPIQVPQQEAVVPTLQNLQNQAQQFLGTVGNLARGALAGGAIGPAGQVGRQIGQDLLSGSAMTYPEAMSTRQGMFGPTQTFASPTPEYTGIPMQNQYEMYNPFSGMGGMNPMNIFRGANGEQYIVDPKTGEIVQIGAQGQEGFLSGLFARNAAPAPRQPDPMLNQNQQFMNDQLNEIKKLQQMGAGFATPTPGQF